MSDYINIDSPVDFRDMRGRRVVRSLRDLFEKNDAKWIPADVREVKHGRWNEHPLGLNECSVCGYLCGIVHNVGQALQGYPTLAKYCPNCGAQMDMRADKESGE